jgi:drug/metabolite transporter (DMT)-like permease
MCLALGKSSGGLKSIALAVLTGAVIAAYTVTDGIGVRLAGDSYSYAAWIFLTYGMLVPVVFCVLRGRLVVSFSSRQTWIAAVAGLAQLLSYAVVLWAFTLSPLGPVSALRETSIVFALLIGWRFLGESLAKARLAACAAIALGAFGLTYHT